MNNIQLHYSLLNNWMTEHMLKWKKKKKKQDRLSRNILNLLYGSCTEIFWEENYTNLSIFADTCWVHSYSPWCNKVLRDAESPGIHSVLENVCFYIYWICFIIYSSQYIFCNNELTQLLHSFLNIFPEKSKSFLKNYFAQYNLKLHAYLNE
jgi:hypothetical protein